MEKIFYNKLCRDKIPEIIHERGFSCEVREVEREEYRREIIRKIFEEASGVSNHANRESLLKELADLLITIDAMKLEYDITDMEIHEAIAKSMAERGGYEKKLYLSWSSDTEYQSHDKEHYGFDD